MKYYPSINPGCNGFFVPLETIDNIDLCTAPQLRALLLALGSGDSGCDSIEIARKLNFSEDDACDLLDYWVKRKILCSKTQDSKNIIPINENIPKLKPPTQKPSMKEIEQLSKEPEVSFVLDEAQRILGNSYTSSDTSTIVWLLKWAGISPEVLVTIMQYCAKKNKPHLRYVQTVALDWLDDGINTIEQCEERIKALNDIELCGIKYKELLAIIDRDLSSKEKEICTSWKVLQFSDELVKLANERCINNTGKTSISYINKILLNWKQKGICSVEDAVAEQNEKKDSQLSPSFDINEIERRMRMEDGVI